MNIEQLTQMIELGQKLGIVELKDQESLIDGNSVIMLTAKVNALASVLLKDQPISVKNEFKEAWKSEYMDMYKRKNELILKLIRHPDMMKILDMNESELDEFVSEYVEILDKTKEITNKSLDMVMNSISSAEF